MIGEKWIQPRTSAAKLYFSLLTSHVLPVSDARELILGRVRAALAPLPARAAYPEFPDEVATHRKALDGRGLWDAFAERVKLVNGVACADVRAAGDWLRTAGVRRGYCDPALWQALAAEFGAGLEVETTFDVARLDEYEFGITRAAGAIAETGTVILRDAQTSSRLGALAPWTHVAVFPRAKLYATVAEAAAALGHDPHITWVTGPSKTADVEGILIEGVHGPGRQLVVAADFKG